MGRGRLGGWLIAGWLGLGAGPALAWNADGAPAWRPEDFPLVFALQRDGSDDVSDGSDLAAVERGFAAWSEPACTSVVVRRGTDLPAPEDLSGCARGENLIQWEEGEWPEDLGARVLAVTLSCFTRTVRLGTTMRFNGVDHTWSTRGDASGTFDIAAVATHEAGHVLGLGHTDDPEATMFRATAPGDRDQRSLEPDDVAGICALYPLITVGARCVDDADCAGEEEAEGGEVLWCRTDWPGGYCTRGCEDTCPGSAACAAPPGEPGGLCLVTCTPGATPCGPGYVCHAEDGGDGICAPPCVNDDACPQGRACVAGTCMLGQAGILDEEEVGCSAAGGAAGWALALALVGLAGRRRRVRGPAPPPGP